MNEPLVFIVPEPTTYAQRKDPSDRFELELVERLDRRGWAAQRYGQGVLTEKVRAMLKRTRSLLRWQPDVLAVRPSTAVYFDAKTELTTSLNHAIETMAHRAHLTRMASEDVPVLYVWPDWTAQVASRIAIRVHLDGRGTRGSGTPFILAPKTCCQPFDDVIGLVESSSVTWAAEATVALDGLALAVSMSGTNVDWVP